AQLCRTYWSPLYAFLRRQGTPPAEAEDLVQGFFEQFLSKDYLRDVAREKGRFRSFLLASLRHFVANHHRDRKTQRRGGALPHLALDEPGVRERCESAAASPASPEATFDRLWAATVMERAARGLRAEYMDTGRGTLFEVLRTWLAREPQTGEYARVAPDLGLSEGALAVAVLRLRRRFRERIRQEVAQTVATPGDITGEMRHLLQVLTST
ncbi:MAG: sigma-70 family RNA polymerase sigma factor, partial [Verrucomicrobiales bacterium]|nr:sigma-70 family RNA polymerase sigma factor [Verrucomicrobiales bacterium]